MLPTVASEPLLLHVPPPGVHVRVVVDPSHTTAVPLIPVGADSTVNTAELEQPALTVYNIVTVPADTPVTKP